MKAKIRNAFLGLAAGMVLLAAGNVHAIPLDPYRVTTLSNAVDPNDNLTSLREAIQSASIPTTFGTEAPTITFADGLSGTIYLEQYSLFIDSSLTIQGPSDNTITIDFRAANLGTTSDRTKSPETALSGGGVFTISAGAIVSLNNLVITKGNVFQGGGIYNLGNLTVNNSTISENTTYQGGGIYNEGNLTVNNSTISNNSADRGGGIYSWQNAFLTVNNSTISNNFADRFGGGIYSDIGNLTVINSTVSGNQASQGGGGILKSGGAGNLILVHSTIARNDGGGIFSNQSFQFMINNILAENKGFDYESNEMLSPGEIVLGGQYAGNNLVQNTNLPGLFPDEFGNIVGPGVYAGLDPAGLQDNGGRTQTIKLIEMSQAIDAGDDCVVNIPSPCQFTNFALTTDQRGDGFQRLSGMHVDMGAFEVGQNADSIAPTANPIQSPTPNGAGWNNTNVTVMWNWMDDDGGSGIDPDNCTMSSTSSAEGSSIVLSATCRDLAGNVGSSSYMLKIDRTAPTVNYEGNAGSYSVDQTVSITCTAADQPSLSGIASSTCADINGEAYSFGLGANTYSAEAMDNADNSGEDSTTFTVVLTPQSFDNLITRFCGDDTDCASGLIEKAHSISVARPKAKAKVLSAFNGKVKVLVRTGRLTSEEGEVLIRLAANL